VLTQHGTLLYGLDRATMFSVLKPSELKLSDKQAASFGEGIVCVRELCSASIEELYDALLKGFTAGKEWEFGTLSSEETARVKDIKRKYQGHEWNFSR